MNDMNGNFPWNNGPAHLFSTKAPKLSKKLIIDKKFKEYASTGRCVFILKSVHIRAPQANKNYIQYLKEL